MKDVHVQFDLLAAFDQIATELARRSQLPAAEQEELIRSKASEALAAYADGSIKKPNCTIQYLSVILATDVWRSIAPDTEAGWETSIGLFCDVPGFVVTKDWMSWILSNNHLSVREQLGQVQDQMAAYEVLRCHVAAQNFSSNTNSKASVNEPLTPEKGKKRSSEPESVEEDSPPKRAKNGPQEPQAGAGKERQAYALKRLQAYTGLEVEVPAEVDIKALIESDTLGYLALYLQVRMCIVLSEEGRLHRIRISASGEQDEDDMVRVSSRLNQDMAFTRLGRWAEQVSTSDGEKDLARFVFADIERDTERYMRLIEQAKEEVRGRCACDRH